MSWVIECRLPAVPLFCLFVSQVLSSVLLQLSHLPHTMSRSAATLVTSIIKDVEGIPLTKHTSCASLADANRLREIDSNSSKKLRGYLKKFLEYELPMFIEGRNMIFFPFLMLIQVLMRVHFCRTLSWGPVLTVFC